MAAGLMSVPGVSGVTGAAMLSDSQSMADSGSAAASGVPVAQARKRPASLVRIQVHRLTYVSLGGTEITQIGISHQSQGPEDHKHRQQLEKETSHGESCPFCAPASSSVAASRVGFVRFIYGFSAEITPFRTP
jgi:hypothetical protein